jgi:uncharacterized protein YkwD
MLRVRSAIALLAALALLAAGVESSTAGTTATTVAVTRSTSLETLVLDQVNAVRARHGMRPLTLSSELSKAAVAHSRSMASLGFFAHESRNGGSFSERIRRVYEPRSGAWTVGENLAMFGGSAPTADAIVAAWMSSPGHRDNLLRGAFREAGIGIVHNPAAGGVFGGEPTWLVTLDIGRR